MSVFVRASLQGPPKTSPGHVGPALYAWPTHEFAKLAAAAEAQAAKAHTARIQASTARAQASGATPPRPTPLGTSSQARLML